MLQRECGLARCMHSIFCTMQGKLNSRLRLKRRLFAQVQWRTPPTSCWSNMHALRAPHHRVPSATLSTVLLPQRHESLTAAPTGATTAGPAALGRNQTAFAECQVVHDRRHEKPMRGGGPSPGTSATAALPCGRPRAPLVVHVYGGFALLQVAADAMPQRPLRARTHAHAARWPGRLFRMNPQYACARMQDYVRTYATGPLPWAVKCAAGREMCSRPCAPIPHRSQCMPLASIPAPPPPPGAAQATAQQ